MSENHKMFIFIVFLFLSLLSQHAFAGFINVTQCTVSYSQDDVTGQEQACEQSLAGVNDTITNAWANGQGIPPQNAIFDFSFYATLEKILLVIAFERDEHFITKIKVEVQTY